MSSLKAVGRSAAARKNDRVSLCSFTFSDGRRCRTPRIRNHPHFCFYHVQKEARARTAEKLGKDLAYFFSGEYLSACDLSTSLGRLIPAVVRGDVKPRTARTVAYLAQTLLQSIHLAQHEYINAFGTDGWRHVIRNSVNDNHDYRYPPRPEPIPAPSHPVCHPERSEGSHPIPATQPEPAQPQTQSQQPGPSSRTPMPRTSAEFVQQVIARLQTGAGETPQPAAHPIPAVVTHPAAPVSPARHPERSEGPQPIPATQPSAVIPPALFTLSLEGSVAEGNPVASFANGGEGSASSSSSSAPSPISAHVPPTPAPSAASPRPVCHPERSEGSQLDPAAPPIGETHPAPAVHLAPSVAPTTPQPARKKDPNRIYLDDNCRLLIDGKPF
jgi:hypothetical protein